MVILAGIFVLRASTAAELRFEELAQALLPILLAAVCYPLGNRKLMQYCPPEISTLERVFGMTLCSMPFCPDKPSIGSTAIGSGVSAQVPYIDGLFEIDAAKSVHGKNLLSLRVFLHAGNWIAGRLGVRYNLCTEEMRCQRKERLFTQKGREAAVHRRIAV